MKTKLYKIKKGNHFARPIVAHKIRNGLQVIGWRVKYHSNCREILPHPHDQSWNKGGGVNFFNSYADIFNPSSQFWDHHINSVMWGWRWNEDSGKLDLCPYFHIDGARIHPGHDGGINVPVYNIELEQWFDIFIHIDYNLKTYTVYFEINEQQHSFEIEFTHNKRLTKELNFYHGGQLPAQHLVSCSKGNHKRLWIDNNGQVNYKN